MASLSYLTVLASLSTFALVGQSEERLGFEVATIRPNLSGSSGSQLSPKHGDFKAENASLKTLISSAYAIPEIRISGPGWLESVRFDINAKGGPQAPESQVMRMLQTLLEERFHLKSHREVKEMRVGLLMVAQGGLKVHPFDAANPTRFPHLPAGGWSVLQMTGSLEQFAGRLSSSLKQPVLDRTGNKETFQLRLYYNDRPESDGPDLFAALQEQLGLRLAVGRDSVEMLVVDSADEAPTEN